MRLAQLRLENFRCYQEVELDPAPSFTVITGANGQGKTSLLEAVSWFAHGRSFRRVPDAALIRIGEQNAFMHTEVEMADSRNVVFDAEISMQSRSRLLRNGQKVTRGKLFEDKPIATVFSPDDLELIKGGPAQRREYLDELSAATSPRVAALLSDYEKALRQRNALLRDGLRGRDASSTLEVFDAQLVEFGSDVLVARIALIAEVEPLIGKFYERFAGADPGITGRYKSEWLENETTKDSIRKAFGTALLEQRDREFARGLTVVGPHRDDWQLNLGERDSRVHASQGEQRSLALALRLAAHELTTARRGEPGLLLLDDVFSELDSARTHALVTQLPASQTLITTAGVLPVGIHPELVVQVTQGEVKVV